jgi:cation transport regulator ChaC
MKPDIEPREDVNPDRGLHEYGDVEFADPVNHKYPIDTPGHVRAAWSYINQSDNAAKYSPEDVEKIKDRIRKAAGKHGIDINRSEEDQKS